MREECLRRARITNYERLPPELIEQIFDCLQQDNRALKVCSLVCKAWLYPAYRRLFYETHLNSQGLAATYGSRSKSIATPCIRRLHILEYSVSFWNNTFQSLEGFDAVTSLTLGNDLPWNDVLPEVRCRISTQFIAITRLHIQKVATTSFSELAEIICTFRCLETLLLGTTKWDTSNNASPSLRLPQHLRALELDRSDMAKILKWFSSFGQDLTLRHVCLLGPLRVYNHIIDAFLRVLGPSLESFRIRLQGAIRPVRLDHNTHLRFLYLDIWRRQESEIGLVPLLSGAVSAHMEKVSLKILQFPSHGVFRDCVSLEWGDVDTVLAGQPFLNLKSVDVRHIRYNFRGANEGFPFEWFIDRLPLCYNRGILRLCEGRTWGPFL